MASNYTIYTGHVWRDYGSNKWILTLSGIKAGALQSAIPIFIALVGPFTWILVKYPWFRNSVLRQQRRNTFKPYYYRQKQVLLRNSAGDLGTIMDAGSLLNTWRKGDLRDQLFRTGPLLIVAFIFFWAWQAIGVISFFIWQYTPPPIGLIRSSSCGYNVLDGPPAELPFRRTGLSQTIQAETYVTQCYGSSSSGACNVFATQALTYNTSDGICPFDSADICISTNSTPFQLDSGLIDSHIGLGINAPPKNRVTYQKITTCSPIHSTQFARIVWANTTDEADYWPPETQLQQFYFGPIEGTNVSYTFEYSDWAPLDGFGYDLDGILFNPGPPGFTNAWIPNSTFTNRTDADVSLLWLTPNAIKYNATVYDPWFLADVNYTITVNGEVLTLYLPDFNVYMMGCIDQHRFCNPVNDICTPFGSYLNTANLLKTIRYNPTQLATAERIGLNVLMSLTFNSVSNRRAAALLASQTVADVLQTKLLPMNQWRIEVENWFAVSLAKLQEGILEFAAGPTDPDTLPYVTFPQDAETAKLCYNQLVQLPSGYSNFDFGAIIVVTVIGFTIVLMAFLFEPIAEWWTNRNDGEGLKLWREDGLFHLLKGAYGHRITLWENDEGDFPLTRLDTLPGSTPQSPAPSPVQPHQGNSHSANGSTIPLLNLSPHAQPAAPSSPRIVSARTL